MPSWNLVEEITRLGFNKFNLSQKMHNTRKYAVNREVGKGDKPM